MSVDLWLGLPRNLIQKSVGVEEPWEEVEEPGKAEGRDGGDSGFWLPWQE